MRSGTQEIITCLRRQRSLQLSRQTIADLAEDVLALGKEKFIAEVLALIAPVKRDTRTSDPMLQIMTRYRKQAGLSTADFNLALNRKLANRMTSEPSKSTLGSAPKYLAHLRRSFSAADIEAGFAHVLKEFG